MPANEKSNFLYSFLIDPKFRIGRHMLFGVAFGFIVTGQTLFVFGNHLDALGSKIYWLGAGNLVAIMAFAYVNLYFLAPRLLLKNQYVEYFITLLAGTSVYLVAKSVIEAHMLSDLGIVRHYNLITLLDGVSNLTLYTICLASSSVSILFRQWVADTEKIDDLKNKNLRKSVDDIIYQVNPQFLSHMLDYVSERVKTDSQDASDILFKLSDVLRYELYDCKREKVILESDIQFLNKYLQLEQINHHHRFSYTLQVAEKTNLFVPPFIFMPVIQKILEQKPASLQIRFVVKDRTIRFECNVLGADLRKCDYSKEEQKLKSLYQKEISIQKNVTTVELQLEAC